MNVGLSAEVRYHWFREHLVVVGDWHRLSPPSATACGTNRCRMRPRSPCASTCRPGPAGWSSASCSAPT